MANIRNTIFAAAAAVPLAYAMPAHAYSWQMWGYEACTVVYQTLADGAKMPINGCSPDRPGSTDGRWFRMEGPFATLAACTARKQAIAAEDPPYTYGSCIEFNN